MDENEKLIKIFEYALNQENTGMTFFRNSLERMGVGSAISAFEKLIKEEEKHIRLISGILADLKGGKGFQAPPKEDLEFEHVDYFNERAKNEFLQQCVEGSMVPDVTVFNTAWLIEKDLSEFYANMARQTQGEAHEALDALSNWEKEHERFFREYRDKLSETYANMPWGG
jgi:rubrerythrin